MSIRKLAIGMIIILAVILLISRLFTAATTGNVAITAGDKSDTISLTWLGDKAQVKTTNVGQGQGKLSARVKVGPYGVTVTDGSFSVQQVIQVKAHQTVTLSLTPAQLGAVEPVSDTDATNLSAASSGLTFTDAATKKLYSIDAQNNEHLLDSSYLFSQIEWADAAFGVGRSSANGALYAINNGQISPLTLPVNIADPNASFGLAPNHELYISDGTSLYSGVAGSTLKLIDTESKHVNIIAAGNKAVLMSVRANDNHGSGLLITVTPSGSKHTNDGEAYEAAWSPSGDSLAISSDEATIITNASLAKTGNIPASNINSPVWLSDTTFFYGVADGLWSYDPTTGRANLVATMPNNYYVGAITPSFSADYMYLQVENNAGNVPVNSLYRVGLNNQTAAPAATILGLVMPLTFTGCTIDFFNFTTPVIMVHGAASAQAGCDTQTKAYLQPYSSVVNLSTVPYKAVTSG